MEILTRDINAFKDVRSRVIGITYTSSDPALAAAVANRTVELYLAALIERNRADRNAALNSLNERIPYVRAEVARADAALDQELQLPGLGRREREIIRRCVAKLSH